MVSLAQKFGPHMNKGGAILALSFVAAERVVPGYGGGMSPELKSSVMKGVIALVIVASAAQIVTFVA